MIRNPKTLWDHTQGVVDSTRVILFYFPGAISTFFEKEN